MYYTWKPSIFEQHCFHFLSISHSPSLKRCQTWFSSLLCIKGTTMTSAHDQIHHRHETWIQKKERGERSAFCHVFPSERGEHSRWTDSQRSWAHSWAPLLCARGLTLPCTPVVYFINLSPFLKMQLWACFSGFSGNSTNYLILFSNSASNSQNIFTLVANVPPFYPHIHTDLLAPDTSTYNFGVHFDLWYMLTGSLQTPGFQGRLAHGVRFTLSPAIISEYLQGENTLRTISKGIILIISGKAKSIFFSWCSCFYGDCLMHSLAQEVMSWRLQALCMSEEC